MHNPFFMQWDFNGGRWFGGQSPTAMQRNGRQARPRPLRRRGQRSKALRTYLTIRLSRESFLPPRRFRMMASLVSLIRAVILL